MRLVMDPRARRLLRIPKTNPFAALELVLLALLALQCARLFWTVVTPVGPVGDWQASAAAPGAPGAAALAGEFDPFFRLNRQSGPVVVTALSLQLFGVRQDQASGRGSAIIATPDGQQRSFAVGDEIVPGVTLKAVGFDSVTISRGGSDEQLFMDQSPDAQVVGPGPAVPPGQGRPIPSVTVPTVVVPAAPPIQTAPAGAAAGISAQPRLNGAQLTGVYVSPMGNGDAFRAAGFAPGDVVVSVNGRRITSPDQARALAAQIGGRNATFQVERAGRTVTLRPGSGR